MIPETVIAKLWQVYGVQKREISRTQRRGAIIVLGMLATATPEIVVSEMETMLRIGLGAYGVMDLQLAKYTCVALRRINPTGRQAKESAVKFSRLANDHAVLGKLAAITEVPSDSKEWYGGCRAGDQRHLRHFKTPGRSLLRDNPPQDESSVFLSVFSAELSRPDTT